MSSVLENELNKGIDDWRKQTVTKLKDQFSILNIKHVPRSPSPVPSQKALRAWLAFRDDLVNKIKFKFPRHMVFVEKGLGRDTPIARQGQTNRVKKEWFNPVIEDAVDKLTDICAENAADFVANNLRIH